MRAGLLVLSRARPLGIAEHDQDRPGVEAGLGALGLALGAGLAWRERVKVLTRHMSRFLPPVISGFI
jgi:hypothetical protein